MKNKKREGSALVSILAITIILLTLGSIIITSVINTTKSNANNNNKKDLQYAAESGIEIARGYFMGPEGKDGVIDTITNESDRKLVKSLEQGIVGKVSLTSLYAKNDDGTEDENRIIVKSEAFHRDDTNKSEKIRITLKKNLGGTNLKNIFEYGAVASKGDIVGVTTGAIDSNADMAAARNIEMDKGTGEKVKIDKEEIQYLNMEKASEIFLLEKINENDSVLKEDLRYGFYKQDRFGSYENIKITELEMNSLNDNFVTTQKNGQQIEIKLDDLKKTDNKLTAVTRLRIKDAAPWGITMLFINSDKLEFKLSNNTLKLSGVVLLNKGSIAIEEKGVLELGRSTLYGSEIQIIKESSIKMSGESGDPAVGKPDPGNDRGSCIPTKNFDRLNVIISKFINGWAGNSNGNSESGSFEVEESPYN